MNWLLAAASAAALALSAMSASAAPCANANALGTARVLAVDAATTPRVGRQHFQTTLPLAPREVVLTFDDGPFPPTTARVLDAMRDECVRASFFLLGRNAVAYPALGRRALAEGHTIAHHTYSHPLLNRMAAARADAEIDRGMAAVDGVLYGHSKPRPVTPFFRFPGFASNAALLDRLEQRGIVVFGSDLWASDWNAMTANQELGLVMSRLEATSGGILLFHDTKAATAALMPAFLRILKTRGYRVVHVVPSGGVVAR